MFGVREVIQFTMAIHPKAHQGSKEDVVIRQKGELLISKIVEGLKSRKKISNVAKSVALDIFELSSVTANWLSKKDEVFSEVKMVFDKAANKHKSNPELIELHNQTEKALAVAARFLEIPIVQAQFIQVMSTIGKVTYQDLAFEMQEDNAEHADELVPLNTSLYLNFGFIATDIIGYGLYKPSRNRISELTSFIKHQTSEMEQLGAVMEELIQGLVKEGKYEEFLESISKTISSIGPALSSNTLYHSQKSTDRDKILQNLVSSEVYEFSSAEFDAVTEELLKGNKPDVERYKKTR